MVFEVSANAVGKIMVGVDHLSLAADAALTAGG
jgi:hypothetical protein